MLEVELSMMEQSRDKLSDIRENRESLLSSSQTELTEMEHLVERVEVEERRVQEMMLELNNQYNKVGFFFCDSSVDFLCGKNQQGNFWKFKPFMGYERPDTILNQKSLYA